MRKLVILFLLAMAMTMVAPVMAQDSTTFCGDLEAADCDLLTASSTAMAGLSSVTADINVQLDVENIPNAPTININLAGTAAYSISDDAKAAAAGTTMDLDTIKTLLGGFGGDLALVLTVPQELATQAGLPGSTIDLQLKLVDGVGYINFEPLDALAGGALAAQGLKGWGGIDFVDLLTKAAAANPDALSSLGNLGAGSAANTDAMSAMTQYVTIERGEDEDGLATFTTTVDFASLVNDPAFQDLIKTSAASSGQTMSDADFQQALGILNVIGNEMEITSTQYIDPETG
ncbi:MAG TPA: hypothetical protein VHL11_17960, partial [Phototrophicaceae bacterium]|nr:hypothetical protein [Phototrophicaceae bacterium]